jgi:head-tail adaptor
MLGKMDTWITIVEKQTTNDNAGFEVFDTYDTILSTRAVIENRKINEFWANLATFSSADTLFRFRKQRGITIDTGMNIIVGNPAGPSPDEYNILSVDEIKGAGMYWEILAERITPSRS